ncbi:MAG: serine/threonine protein kinase [bacterium]|nr:serine/threonine protein kinase [bacterium]
MSHAAPRRDLVGKLIANRYLVGDVLGAGGLCTVYRGEDLRKQSDVAIKVLPAEKAQVKEFAARFQREVTTAKRIDHPNVAAISDSGELPDGALFLVMELLKGTLLSNALHDGALPPARALVIARQMLVGLGRAHELGVVHRDVKPDNVMLIKVGGLETVKLFDFGIASNDRAAMKLTAPGTAFGTPEYIAPEQAMGQKVDARADLYGVAGVLFEMLCGRLPFVCKDDIAYLRAHIKETPPAPSSVAPPDAKISRAVDTLVLRALEKDPDKRFKDANEMIAAIDSAAGHKPLRIGERRPLLWIALVLLVITAALIVGARFVGTDWLPR